MSLPESLFIISEVSTMFQFAIFVHTVGPDDNAQGVMIAPGREGYILVIATASLDIAKMSCSRGSSGAGLLERPVCCRSRCHYSTSLAYDLLKHCVER